MKKKDPAHLFYPSDFLALVCDLTFEERGELITIWCLQSQTGHLDSKTIKINVPNVSSDVLDKLVEDEEGKYYIQILEEAIQKRREYSAKQRAKAMQRWNPSTTEEYATVSEKEATAYPEAEPGECLKINVNENININKIINNKSFKDIVKLLQKSSFIVRGNIDELKLIAKWLVVDFSLVEESIAIAYSKNIFELSYVDGIIKNKAKQMEQNSKKLPEWFDKDLTITEPNENEKKELESILQNFN
ncbi:MAG: hypothetical protein J6B89_03615 [Bacilli bacterium]|nr:hypothetical protein [Bacilli bacterium]